ncbi:MAG: uroporphyrinogen-III synthase, partial [Thiohalorhabdaceae bacterium]
MSDSLKGRRVALPESRELDLLARMLAERGAEAVRCPLVSIHDNPEQGPVRDWIGRLVAGDMDHLVLFTGEGLRRLLPVAEAMGAREAFVAALESTPVTARGPKPARELRQLGLKPDHAPEEATTQGLIGTLSALDLDGVRSHAARPGPP